MAKSFPCKNCNFKGLFTTRDFIRSKTDKNKQHKLDFGKYYEVHDDLESTNSMKKITPDAITMGTTVKIQCSYIIFSWNTSHKLTECSWTKIPMGSLAITKVEKFYEKELRDGVWQVYNQQIE